MRVYSNSDQGFYTEWRGYYFPGRHITFMVIFILCLQKNNSHYKHKTAPCNMALIARGVWFQKTSRVFIRLINF